MERKQLHQLLLDGLLVAKVGRLVAHDCVHVSLERIHVLTHGDPMLLGLV